MTLSELRENLKHVPHYIIEIGVVDQRTNRKETAKVGITNADLMFIHENGSPTRSIPSRPVLQMTIDWARVNLINQTLTKFYKVLIDSSFNYPLAEKEFEKMCMRMQTYARKIIYSNDGRLAPNAPSTIARKGDNHPLFDTGQLARSITCTLRKL